MIIFTSTYIFVVGLNFHFDRREIEKCEKINIEVQLSKTRATYPKTLNFNNIKKLKPQTRDERGGGMFHFQNVIRLVEHKLLDFKFWD